MSAPKPLFTLAELEAAVQLVHRTVPPTPQYAWPLLAKRTGCVVWVKHENHTPTCAFKVRGGVVYMDNLKRSRAKVTGVISATRGNHGQSIAFSAARAGISATIYVPHGNSADQNAAMRAFEAVVVEFGRDFDEALAECHRVAHEQDLHFIPPFNRDQVKGVATYALELLRAVADLHTVYVPIGMGSGICGLIWPAISSASRLKSLESSPATPRQWPCRSQLGSRFQQTRRKRLPTGRQHAIRGKRP
jgi:threonine dehydratase